MDQDLKLMTHLVNIESYIKYRRSVNDNIYNSDYI